MLHHDSAVGIGRVVDGPQHQPGNLVKRIVRFRPAVGPIGRVGIDIDIVAVVDAEVFGGLGVHV